jgi:hypothetical protein
MTALTVSEWYVLYLESDAQMIEWIWKQSA